MANFKLSYNNKNDNTCVVTIDNLSSFVSVSSKYLIVNKHSTTTVPLTFLNGSDYSCINVSHAELTSNAILVHVSDSDLTVTIKSAKARITTNNQLTYSIESITPSYIFASPGTTATFTITYADTASITPSEITPTYGTVENNQLIIPVDDSMVGDIESIVRIHKEFDVGIGVDSTTTNSNIPTSTTSAYSISQSLYQASEIGTPGTIKSISICNDSYSSAKRSFDIYMNHTSKTSFATDGSDWVTVTNDDKVFSGNVSIKARSWNSEAWKTIYLTKPFVYDGTSTLAVTFDGNTVTTTSTACLFKDIKGDGTTKPQTLVINGNTNYDPLTVTAVPPQYNGGVYKAKPSVKFHIVYDYVDKPDETPAGYARIGGKLYKVTTSNGVTIMAENLALTFDSLDTDSTHNLGNVPSAHYYSDNLDLYGYVGLAYNENAVAYLISHKDELTPGWHVPTIREWLNAIGDPGQTAANGFPMGTKFTNSEGKQEGYGRCAKIELSESEDVSFGWTYPGTNSSGITVSKVDSPFWTSDATTTRRYIFSFDDRGPNTSYYFTTTVENATINNATWRHIRLVKD